MSSTRKRRPFPKACALCGSQRLAPYLTLRDGHEILICADCTNGITAPPPQAEYDDHPFFLHAQFEEELWRQFSRETVRFIQRHVGSTGRLLDVGCSHGLLLEEARAIGFEVQGIEPSKSASSYCQQRGLPVQNGYLVEGRYAPQSFDLVVLSQVIEHLENPLAMLEMVYKVLKPRGALLLCQTNYQGTLPRWLGPYWSYWVQHEHYFHFSPKGIEAVLRRAGFTLRTLELQPLSYRFPPKIQALRQVAALPFHFFTYIVSQAQLGFPYRGDQMLVLAQPSIG